MFIPAPANPPPSAQAAESLETNFNKGNNMKTYKIEIAVILLITIVGFIMYESVYAVESKILCVNKCNGRTYTMVNVDGRLIQIKNAIDDADAIKKAEALAAYKPEEIPVVTVKEAIEIVIKADLTKEDKVQLLALSAKVTTAIGVAPK